MSVAGHHAPEHAIASGRKLRQADLDLRVVVGVQARVALVDALLALVLDAQLEEHRLDRAVEPDADQGRRLAERGGGAGIGAADERVRSRLERQERQRRYESAGDHG
jgi:hypothetical protein